MLTLIRVAVAPEVTPTIVAAVGVPDVVIASATSLSVAAPINQAVAYFNISPRAVTETGVSEANVPSASAPYSP